MSYFEVVPVQQSTILYIYSLRDEIDLEPEYQRMGDIWPVSKRQLLIDSLLNGFDVPKIYVHEFQRLNRKAGQPIRYAVVDGKQRLSTIWQFIAGEFALADDFTFREDPSVDLAGLSYAQLAKQHAKIKMRFDALSLPILAIRTDDIELIEEMFTRLNEAAPLNAAEKRNAFGGPLPKQIRELAQHPFFRSKVAFSNRRYRHFDVGAKLLLLESREKIEDTKKLHLDRFVRGYRDKEVDDAANLTADVRAILDAMSAVFGDNDPLLRSVGIVPVLFWVSRILHSLGPDITLDRDALVSFEEARKWNRQAAQEEEDGADIDWEMLEYDRLTQTPNDAYAIRFRIQVLAKHILDGEQLRMVLASIVESAA